MQARGTKSVQNNLRLRFIALALTMAKLRAEIIRDLFIRSTTLPLSASWIAMCVMARP
jgi:hypothetical protein